MDVLGKVRTQHIILSPLINSSSNATILCMCPTSNNDIDLVHVAQYIVF